MLRGMYEQQNTAHHRSGCTFHRDICGQCTALRNTNPVVVHVSVCTKQRSAPGVRGSGDQARALLNNMYTFGRVVLHNAEDSRFGALDSYRPWSPDRLVHLLATS